MGNVRVYGSFFISVPKGRLPVSLNVSPAKQEAKKKGDSRQRGGVQFVGNDADGVHIHRPVQTWSLWSLGTFRSKVPWRSTESIILRRSLDLRETQIRDLDSGIHPAIDQKNDLPLTPGSTRKEVQQA